MSYTAATETPLVLFDFEGDDWGFRNRLLDALDDGELPGCYKQIESRTYRGYAGFWRPEHAPAVRAWAEANGIRVGGPLL